MMNSYTLVYLINNFETNTDELIDFERDYFETEEICNLLLKLETEPSDQSVDNILHYSISLLR